MSAPETKEQWGELADELAAFRAGRGPESFSHVFGVEPGALCEWCAEDAVDTMNTVIPAAVQAGEPVDQAVAAALATHTQIGIELGLFLVSTGRVQP